MTEEEKKIVMRAVCELLPEANQPSDRETLRQVIEATLDRDEENPHSTFSYVMASLHQLASFKWGMQQLERFRRLYPAL